MIMLRHSTVRVLRIAAATTAAIAVFAVPVMALANAIDSVFKYAWGENIGWLNFGTAEGGVDVGASALTGYVWGENIGWISLNCSNTSTCATVDYKISNSGGTLTGYAYGENVGWISFSCSNTSTCGTVNYGVTIDTFTGSWSGYAWGENVGWVSMNCSNTSSCATVDYHVANVGLLPPPGFGTGGAVGGGNSGPPPPLPSTTPGTTPTPTPLVSFTPSPTASPSVSTGGTPGSNPPPGVPPASQPPPTGPGPEAPTSPPPDYSAPSPSNPIVEVVNQIGQGLDTVSQAIFGEALPPPATAASDVAAAVAAVPVVTAAASILARKELAATTHSMFQAIGLKKKARVWGTIYDSKTKHPVPLAKVQLFDDAGRLLETRFADRDGRYGFLTTPRSLHEDVLKLRIVAEKDGYQFPSQMSAVGTDFIVYDHLYRGEIVEIWSETLLNFNVPLDPTEKAPKSPNAWGIGLFGAFTDQLLNLGFIAGLFLVPLNYVWYPTTMNLIVGILFFGANAIRMISLHRPYGVVKDVATGKVIPFALVTLNDPTGKRVAFAVSDEWGRYFLPAERGAEYTLTAYTPANVVPSRTSNQHIAAKSRTSRRAWVTLNIQL